ncbi:CorA metal ion transporter [Coemansia sp. RSA 990]|nr:CorA metal ion transporter [Coemansia sp. RSA 1086]KAJ1875344.1 CorA metal ion transporter [Coemansia sp. RSA 990]
MGKSKRKSGKSAARRQRQRYIAQEAAPVIHGPAALPPDSSSSSSSRVSKPHRLSEHPSSSYLTRKPSSSRFSGSRHRPSVERSRSHSHHSASHVSGHLSENSDTYGLSNVIMHYMPEIDAEGGNMLASRYYGNMAAIPDSVDRHPLPMNSTLPLFSRSVISGRVDSQARLSSRASNNSSHKVNASTSEQNIAVPRLQRSLSAAHAKRSANSLGAAAAAAMDTAGYSANGIKQASLEIGESIDQNPPLTKVESLPNEEESNNMAQAVSGPAPKEHSRSSSHGDELALSSEHEDILTRRASTGSCVNASVDEKTGGLGLSVSSRSPSQVRRSQHMGPTQYKPATTTKKSAIARAAPGLSYMFSPTVGSTSSSRPASVMGTVTPSHPPIHHAQSQFALSARAINALNEVQQAESQSPVGMDKDFAHSQDSRKEFNEAQNQVPTEGSTPKPETKRFGSINIGALERFLEDGKVPDSSSDDELDENDLGWGEYFSESEMSSVPSRRFSRFSAYRDHQPEMPLSRYASIDEPVAGSHSGRMSQQQPNTQFVAHDHKNTDRSSIPDEQAPLLDAAKQQRAYGTSEPEFIVPADLPSASRASCRPSPESHVAGSTQRQRQRRRRQQREHEELFLDKDGFIDESYRFTFFNPAVGTIRAQEFADLRTPTMDLSTLLQVGGCFWIDVFRPSFQEMHLLSKIFGIHALTVEDVMTQDAREKCEIHANYYFVCFRSFDNDPESETYLEPKCVYNVVLREGIITFHMEPSVHQYHVLRRIRRQIDHIVVTPDWLNYAIIDDITDLLAPILHRVEFDVDAIDELVLVISSSEQSDMLLRISTVRKRIMMALRLLQGKADVVRALIKRFESATAFSTTQINALPAYFAERPLVPPVVATDSPQNRIGSGTRPPISELPEMVSDQRKGHETILYLGDVLDHIVTMIQNATHYDNMLGRAQTNYLAQISIELTESSNNTNDVVAKLSALAAIVVPLNFITGMWGANVKVPGQDYDDLHYFFIILGMCMLYVVVAVCWARRYRIF